MQFLECGIHSCEYLRVGITVNFLFLVLGLVVVLVLQVALNPRDRIVPAVKDELRAHGAHTGYALLLLAGCAFFGAFPIAEALSRLHAPFALSWSGILLLLLLIEMTKARLHEESRRLSLSRVLAIPTSCFFVYWVWSGAYWPEVW